MFQKSGLSPLNAFGVGELFSGGGSRIEGAALERVTLEEAELVTLEEAELVALEEAELVALEEAELELGVPRGAEWGAFPGGLYALVRMDG